MKKVLSFVLALLTGGLLGFFGVFASVFSDGTVSERLITVSVILLLYGALGFILGNFNPNLFWQMGLVTVLPGELILLLYSIKEMSILPYSLGYMILILGFSYFGANFGKNLKNKNKN